MYFETNQVNDVLLCQQCEGRLEGPKILPCGETICLFCVSSIRINNKMFDCLVCNEKHEMPKNGLLDNKVVMKILSVKPTKVFIGVTVDLLEKSLEEIYKKQRLIKHKIENSIEAVINRLGNQLINKIPNFEEKKIEQWIKSLSKALKSFDASKYEQLTSLMKFSKGE